MLEESYFIYGTANFKVGERHGKCLLHLAWCMHTTAFPPKYAIAFTSSL